ncbi:serine/threonine-protein kinase minibrain [Pelomyxa schiedti]|nr:serine/threonine-protein kinase minibrain [Pelomyxa schiedti]
MNLGKKRKQNQNIINFVYCRRVPTYVAPLYFVFLFFSPLLYFTMLREDHQVGAKLPTTITIYHCDNGHDCVATTLNLGTLTKPTSLSTPELQPPEDEAPSPPQQQSDDPTDKKNGNEVELEQEHKDQKEQTQIQTPEKPCEQTQTTEQTQESTCEQPQTQPQLQLQPREQLPAPTQETVHVQSACTSIQAQVPGSQQAAQPLEQAVPCTNTAQSLSTAQGPVGNVSSTSADQSFSSSSSSAQQNGCVSASALADSTHSATSNTARLPCSGNAPRKKSSLLRITVDLLVTYKNFQENRTKRMRAGQRLLQPVTTWDDKNGDCILHMGDLLMDRFEVRGMLGKGSFGQVVKCLDKLRNDEVAVKIIKNKPSFFNQALYEIKILTHLNTHDPNDQAKVVRMREHFKYRNHLCLVFELLSQNLYELLSVTHFHGLSLSLVRKFAVQILTALEFLCSDPVKIIHCDLKPENILLRNPKRSAIKVIDFGSSCYCDDTMYKYIQSRYYRSPEVLLGLPYSYPIDMWSLGCILVELHTGDPLFAGKNEPEQLLKIIEVIGVPPAHMIERSPKLKKLFQVAPNGSYIIHSTLQSRVQPKSLSDILGVESGGPNKRHCEEAGHSVTDYLKFKDLIEKMICYDPTKRITPSVALQHKFFKQTCDETTETNSSPSSTQASLTARNSIKTTPTPSSNHTTELPTNTTHPSSTHPPSLPPKNTASSTPLSPNNSKPIPNLPQNTAASPSTTTTQSAASCTTITNVNTTTSSLLHHSATQTVLLQYSASTNSSSTTQQNERNTQVLSTTTAVTSSTSNSSNITTTNTTASLYKSKKGPALNVSQNQPRRNLKRSSSV